MEGRGRAAHFLYMFDALGHDQFWSVRAYHTKDLSIPDGDLIDCHSSSEHFLLQLPTNANG